MIHELGENLIPVLAIGCSFLFMVIWVVAATLDSMYKTKCNLRLKEQLVQRGMSASEIERVVGASTVRKNISDNFVRPVAPVKV